MSKAPSPMKIQIHSKREIQTALAGLGIYKGKIDGVFGPITLAAIRGFQRMNLLRDDGIVGMLTDERLFPAPIGDRIPTQPDLPILKPPARTIWPKQKDVPKFFGAVGSNQVKVQLPYKKWLAWDLRKSVTAASYHKLVAPSVLRVHNRILSHYGLKEIDRLDLDITGGTLNVRKMRGGTSWSMHSWGIAEDINPARNQLHWKRDRATLDNKEYEAFWGFWEDEGWVSLGRSKDYDWMHVQAARL